MSWTYDFGVVKNADELRKQKPRWSVDTPRLDSDDKKAVKEQGKAALEHIMAVQEAAALILESPAFGDFPVQVIASGQANPNHQPIEALVERHEMQVRNGQIEEVEGVVHPTALETITISITQVTEQQ